jgi:sec-independent protein translocase protein TatC
VSSETAVAKSTKVQDVPPHDVPMGFFEHLEELRKRLIWALLGLIPAMGASWLFKEQLMELLSQPLVTSWKRLGMGAPTLHFAHATDPFMAYLKLSLISSLLVTSPWLFYQVWAFISPGLYHKEKRLVIPFVISSTIFFIGGALFGLKIVFPLGLETLLGFGGVLPGKTLTLKPTLMISEYLDFSMQMLLAFGVVFEIPVVITFLSLLGIVNWKQLIKFSRWWILIATIVAAILTPPDVGSQMMMLIPMIALYFVSILLAYFFGPKVPKVTT